MTTNTIESFWVLLKRGYYCRFRSMSPKHILRYANEFKERHNAGHETMELLSTTVRGTFGRRLTDKELSS